MAQLVKNLPAKAADTTDMGSIPESGRSLENEMATHSSILAREIPWTEKPGGLQSTGSKRVRHDLATKQQQQQGSGSRDTVYFKGKSEQSRYATPKPSERGTEWC